jgi:ABC-type branched-subunit amino acid transport system ATPase component
MSVPPNHDAATRAAPVLQVKRVHKMFGGIRANWDISLDVYDHEIVGLIGPNGSGKTTLIHLIAGYFRADGGQILFNGEALQGLSPHEIARCGVIRTWQDPRIVPSFTVRDNVRLGHLANPARLKDGPSVDELLESFGLAKFADQSAENLSYGQQKVIALARALACAPKLLLLDEPLAGISLADRGKVVEHIRAFRKKGAILIVDHAFGVLAQLCDRVVVLDSGMKLVEGTPESVAADPKVIEVYFG